MRILGAGLLAAAALIAIPASAANLLINGSFEDGINGWTSGGVSGDGFPPVVIPYNSTNGYPTGAFGEPIPPDNAVGNPGFDAVGDHALYFVADLAHPQTLSQLVSITGGLSYTFGFDVYLPANGLANANGATFSATVAGFTFAVIDASTAPGQTWLHYSGAGTANFSTVDSFVLSYDSFGVPAKDFVIDRVYFAESTTVPEPATWAMMLVGFGGLGAVLRRRRLTLALAA